MSKSRRNHIITKRQRGQLVNNYGGHSSNISDFSVKKMTEEEKEAENDEQSLGSQMSIESQDYRPGSPEKMSRMEVFKDKFQNDNKELLGKILLAAGKIHPAGQDDAISVAEDDEIKKDVSVQKQESLTDSSGMDDNTSLADESIVPEDVLDDKVARSKIDNVGSSRQRARAARAIAHREIRLTKDQYMRSIILAEKAASEGEPQFETWKNVDNLQSVSITCKHPSKPKRIVMTARRLRNQAADFFLKGDVNRSNEGLARIPEASS